MSRRMGPGGRLRPAPRGHRNLGHVDAPRPSGFLVPPDSGVHAGPTTGVLRGPDFDGVNALGRGSTDAAPARLQDFDLDDESAPAFAPHPAEQPVRDGPTDPPARAEWHEAVSPASDAPRFVPRPRPEHRPGGTVEAHGQNRHGGNDRHDGPRQDGPLHGDHHPERHGAAEHHAASDRHDRPDRATPTCTAPQLRRFIKSRAYVPMHELRRRFGIDGQDDDVTGVDLENRRVFVGLPQQEGQLLGDLLRNGEVGFELSMDPRTPIVVGVYAMRPVPRA